MKKTAFSLVAILALALAVVPVAARDTIHSVPINPPNCTSCSPAGGFQITVGSPGTITEPINFTIHVVRVADAFNIQAYFIANDSASFAALSSVTAMFPNGTALVKHGPFTGTPWTYPPAGPVFPGSTWFNFTYVWLHLAGGTDASQEVDFTFTVTGPSSFFILGAGNSVSPTSFSNPYRTPYSETTNIVVIPEYFLGTLVAVVMPLLALAGYLRLKGSKQSPIVSLNS